MSLVRRAPTRDEIAKAIRDAEPMAQATAERAADAVKRLYRLHRYEAQGIRLPGVFPWSDKKTSNSSS